MKNLYEPATVDELQRRIATVRADSPPVWGRMNPAQAFAHCAMAMENALGETKLPRHPVGRLIGRWALNGFLVKGKPMGRGAPTHPSVLVKDQRNFEVERRHLEATIDRFASGPAACTRHPHFFFGAMTPDEWSAFMYIHLDHHLRQFNA